MLDNFHQDILREIYLRLSVQDIYRLCLVCKRLNSLSWKLVDVNNIFKRACDKGKLDIVRNCLRDSRLDVRTYGQHVFTRACMYQQFNVVEELVKDGRFPPNSGNNIAIRQASRYGHLKLVKLLLRDSRVDPKSAGNYSLLCACRYGHIEVVRELLNHPKIDIEPNRICNFITGYIDINNLVFECILNKPDPLIT